MKKKQKEPNKIVLFLKSLATDFRWSQVFAMLCLTILSLLFVYSATWKGGSTLPEEFKKQLMWFGFGWGLYFLISLMDYHWICNKAWIIYLFVLGLLILVPIMGKTMYGAKRWLVLGKFTIQPSEFAKISLLLILCYLMGRFSKKFQSWRQIFMAFVLTAIPAALIHKQPDLGTALVVIALFFMILFIANVPMRFFVIVSLIGLLITGALGYETIRYIQYRRDVGADKINPKQAPFRSYLHLKPYQLNRLVGVVAPDELDRLNEGWNLHQSLIAIGSGRFQGKGWTKGNVTRGGYLPRTVSLNDFIFAVYAEETGFIGGVVLVVLYLTILIGGIRIALMAHDSLGTLLASGATFLIFFHVFVNIGMTLGILPVVGVPLPMMSYGGSFVLVCMSSLGLIQSVWLNRKSY